MKKTIEIIVASTFFSFSLAVASELNVLGFELGKPVNLPECEFKLRKSHDGSEVKSYTGYGGKEACITDVQDSIGYLQPVKRIYLAEKEAPDYFYSSGLDIIESDGNLVELRALTHGLDVQDYILLRLKEKYGKPSNMTNKTIRTGNGASYSAIVATWNVKNITVRYEGVYDTLQRGVLTISLPEAIAIKKSWIQKMEATKPKL